ncbi:MAG: DUF2267 domain-containing protein [Sphingomonadaceae bacterium]
MQYDRFVGLVQSRARLGTEGEAVRAIHATLETLGERLFGGEADNLAAQLPVEIGHYLKEPASSESFDLDEFYRRVSVREGVELPLAIFHTRAVIDTLKEAVSPGILDKVLDQLPEEYDRQLFGVTTKGRIL